LRVRYREFRSTGTPQASQTACPGAAGLHACLLLQPTILGLLRLAMMAVRLPMTMVGTAISQVILPESKRGEEPDRGRADRRPGGPYAAHRRRDLVPSFSSSSLRGSLHFCLRCRLAHRRHLCADPCPWLFAVFIVSTNYNLGSESWRGRSLFVVRGHDPGAHGWSSSPSVALPATRS